MRGAISLAAALALTNEIEQRELLIFVTVGVIAVTLVGQGLTLGPLMRRLGIESEREWSPDEAIARLEAAQAALDRLDELEREDRITRGAPASHARAVPRSLPALHGGDRRRGGRTRWPGGAATRSSATASCGAS